MWEVAMPTPLGKNSKQGQSDTRSEKYGVESDFPEPGKSLRDVDFTSERESLEGLDQRCSMT